MSQQPPLCSLPGRALDLRVGEKPYILCHCALSKWFETEGKQHWGETLYFLELQQIHTQLHWVAQEIVWFGSMTHYNIVVNAMEHFNDLWPILFDTLRKINKEIELNNIR